MFSQRMRESQAIFDQKTGMQLNRIKLAEWGIHLLAVTVLVLVAYDSYERSIYEGFLQTGRRIGFFIVTNADIIFWHVLIYSLFVLAWFLFYYGIYQRYEHSIKKKVLGGLVGWFGFSLIHGLLVYLVYRLVKPFPLADSHILLFEIEYEFGETVLIMYFMMAVVAFLAHTTVTHLRRYKELEETDRMHAELSLIRSQLRPHFFFNTLNNLYSMALQTQNEDLANGIQDLTGMMRYSLKQSTEKLVPLSDEWEYIEHYVDLQKLRIEQSNVKINLRCTGELAAVRIAPMILINFVENAFKHGISYEKNSFVDILLEVKAGQIVLSVKNSNHPSIQEKGLSGIGTDQTKRLLSVHYQDTYDLDITSNQEWYRVVLTLPAR